uniref:Zinc finger CCCH-type with G patch domain-containing protein n=1 Tax=Caenorhabditis japonica TaxID=281687 RepID=A0A8R1III4_CAEJA
MSAKSIALALHGVLDPIYDLLGSRCLAPFDSDRSLALHIAIIMEIESSARVRVLFSHPTCPAMKSCSHFLSSTCRYESNCRFCHGYSVELDRIQDYKEPDYNLIMEQKLVLVKGSSQLWELGRISAIDGQNVAVKVLKSGVEVSANRGDLVPIDEKEDADDQQKNNESWSELKNETLGNVSVGELGKWNGGDIGMKLMMKMGYKVGEGLGKRSDGIVHAIQARICSKNASLDEVMNRKRKVVDGKVQRKVKVLKTSDDCEKDIFAFINRKLEQKKERTLADIRQEKQEMASCSSKSLGVKNLDYELELKQLRTKQKKLKEGIQRNQADKNTVAKMTVSMREIDEKIQSIERKMRNVQTEVNSRSSKIKDIF